MAAIHLQIFLENSSLAWPGKAGEVCQPARCSPATACAHRDLPRAPGAAGAPPALAASAELTGTQREANP